MDLWTCRAPLVWLCHSPFMSEGQMFFQSLTNACHAQPPAGEFPAHSQTWLASLLPQAWPWLWAGKLSSWRSNITGVCPATTLHGRCFGRNRRASCTRPFPGWPSARWPRHQQLHSLSGHLSPDHCTSRAPVPWSWLISLWTLCGRTGWSHCPFPASLPKSHSH